MSVFGRRVADTEYGILIIFKDAKQKRKWFGSDENKRNNAHFEWAEKVNVRAVQNITRSK